LERVVLEFNDILSQDAHCDNPLRQLVLLKKAVHTVTRRMHKEGLTAAPESTGDKLGCTLSFIRAAEDLNMHRMRRCAQSYPELARYVHPDNPNARLGSGMHQLREHALELARTEVTQEATTLHNAGLGANSTAYKRKKEHILTKLQRLRPGQTTSVNAVQTAEGEVATDAHSIAAALQSHWAKVFTGAPIDGELLTRWLDTVLGSNPSAPTMHSRGTSNAAAPEIPVHPLPTDPTSWEIRRCDIERAVEVAGESAPGPDQLPYSVWRKLGGFGIDVLWKASHALTFADAERTLLEAYSDEGGCNEHNFNLGILVCLAKKPTGVHEELGEYYALEGTRPLSIVNTDNRIIANAARLRWEPVLDCWISQMQQGFLKGRSIISNLIDLDTESMTISLTTDRGAVVLFDFKAAFPSISQEYIHKVLERLGMPEPCRQLIQSLYNDNKCVIRCHGSMLPGFRLTAGVRQGCPLSPLLFAAAADILLRSLADSCPTATIRAFADDTATASADFWKDAPKMQQIFEQFEQISGLGLHYGKSVIIPLSLEPLPTFQARLRLVVPQWADMQVSTKGTYLGFAVGPGKKDTTWDKPAAKFMARVNEWSNLKTGLQYDTLLYNYFRYVRAFLRQSA